MLIHDEVVHEPLRAANLPSAVEEPLPVADPPRIVIMVIDLVFVVASVGAKQTAGNHCTSPGAQLALSSLLASALGISPGLSSRPSSQAAVLLNATPTLAMGLPAHLTFEARAPWERCRSRKPRGPNANLVALSISHF